MEPLGATASLLTLLASAGQSCKFLYALCVDFSEAPKDIQDQAVKLQSFDIVVQQLLKAYERLPSEFGVDIELREQIALFESEVTSMRIRVERRLDASRQGRKRQLRESCKWLLFDRQMTKFLQSADHWSLIMSHAAMAAQIALSSHIDQNVVALLGLTQRVESARTESAKEVANIPNIYHKEQFLPTEDTLPILQRQDRHDNRFVLDRFAKYLSTLMEPVGFAPQHWMAIRMGTLIVEGSSGYLISRQYSPKGRVIYQALRASEGYGLNLVAQTSWLLRDRVTFLLLATYTAKSTLKLSLRCSLQWVRLFDLDGPHREAVKRGDKDYLIRHLSSRKLGLSDVSIHGDTLLHLAAGHDRSDIIDLLANAGADVNAVNHGGETPLHVCLRVGKGYECARKLLNYGADILRENKDGRTPLHTFFNDAIGQVINYHKDDIDALCQDKRGMTIGHWASWTSQSAPEVITYQSMISEKSLSPYLVLDVHGKSMLHFAAERGNVGLVQYLLRQPEASKLSAPDNEGRTPLHYATSSSRFYLIYPLLATHQPNIYQRDDHGRTFLHYAAMRGNVSAVEHVFELGLLSEMDLEAKDIDGRTPLQLAQLCRRISVVEMLQSHVSFARTIPDQTISDGEKVHLKEEKYEREVVTVRKLRALYKLYPPVAPVVLIIVCWILYTLKA